MMTMLDLQRYPQNLNLMKNVDDNFVFLTFKVFISLILFNNFKHEMRKSILQSSPGKKINSFSKENHLIHTWSEKV